MQNRDIPVDRELTRISTELFPGVLRDIEHQEKRRNRIRWSSMAGVGAVLLASGALLGAAVLAPVFNPGNGELFEHGVFEPATFAISCYTSTSPSTGGTVQQYSSQKDINAALQDLGATCDRLTRRVEVNGAVDAAVQKAHQAGVTCGIVRVVGGGSAYWSYSPSGGGKGGITVTNGTVPSSADCKSTTTVTVPRKSLGKVAACSLASNWIAVYPADSETTASVCRRVGLSVWDS